MIEIEEGEVQTYIHVIKKNVIFFIVTLADAMPERSNFFLVIWNRTFNIKNVWPRKKNSR